MPSLYELQSRVHDAVLGGSTDALKGFVADDRLGHAARLSVYRNNTTILLSDALAANFPTVAALVGEEFFFAMAKLFVRTHPPTNPCLFAYGAGFAGFIEAFAPARELPYLADVARLDFALNESRHAPEAPSLDPVRLKVIGDDAYDVLGFTAHPATRRVSSEYPIHAIWALHWDDGAPQQGVDLGQGGDDVLITYIKDDARPQPLTHGAGDLYTLLTEGARLGEAVDAVQQTVATFDAGTALSQLLTLGAFSVFALQP
ncbi:putative DNA-binding domain-containing protein [Pseudomonadota bacterium]